MTWLQLINYAKKHYGLKKIIWVKDKNLKVTATCDYRAGIVKLNYYRINSRNRYTTLFHELGHIYCYKQGLWKKYHIDLEEWKNTKKAIDGIVKTGFKAEKWVDMWGMNEMKKHYPRKKYHAIYHVPNVKKYYHKYYINPLKECL